jgi:O-antigen ligase
MNAVIENKFSKILAIGSFITTIIIVAGPISDPVNIPKMLSIGILAFSLTPVFFYLKFQRLVTKSRTPLIIFATLMLASFNAMINSDSPKLQNIYGAVGRNTGFLTILAFGIIFLVSANFRKIQSVDRILIGLLGAGVVNIMYAFVNQFIKDPIPWQNIYGAFLGTFGNPDFAGAFLGLVTGLCLAYSLGASKNIATKLIYLLLSTLSIVGVLFTKTTQGLLVAAITVSIVFLVWLKFQFKNKTLIYISLTIFVVTGFMMVMGILQKGPFASILYKRSVSLRGVYWQAALNTGNQNVFTGVGLDSFGDYYRLERSLKAATWFPGPETITNVAHNYFLDMYANGGIFLLMSYVGLTILGFYSAFRVFKKLDKFEVTPVSLIAIYTGFQAQAIISIPQIGVAIWGWIISGLLYSYDKIDISQVSNSKTYKEGKVTESPVGVFVFMAAAVGLFLYVPAYSSEVKWNNAIKSSQLEKVEQALQSSYFNPVSSEKILNAVGLFEQNKLYSYAHKYALEGVLKNSNSYNNWRALYQIQDSTPEDRAKALANMKRLDPLNKNLEKLK